MHSDMYSTVIKLLYTAYCIYNNVVGANEWVAYSLLWQFVYYVLLIQV